MPPLLWRVVDGDDGADIKERLLPRLLLLVRASYLPTHNKAGDEDVAFTVEPKKPRENAAIVEP
ncbi:uncharacterized protein PG986_009792 [Apiospora aurea]|uniref:Uncharacterized protein n=1 Tax=Apiospora aurea TaxID=335848 RepID=A0ABR1Q8P1_9PEZI